MDWWATHIGATKWPSGLVQIEIIGRKCIKMSSKKNCPIKLNSMVFNFMWFFYCSENLIKINWIFSIIGISITFHFDKTRRIQHCIHLWENMNFNFSKVKYKSMRINFETLFVIIKKNICTTWNSCLFISYIFLVQLTWNSSLTLIWILKYLGWQKNYNFKAWCKSFAINKLGVLFFSLKFINWNRNKIWIEFIGLYCW